MPSPLDSTARELVRAIRGPRSQVALSRRLGFRSNIVAKWESGERAIKAKTWLQACKRLGIDVDAGFRRFHEPSAGVVERLSSSSLAAWLRAQRGTQPLVGIADASGCSRYRVSRCLSGGTQPSLDTFLRLTDAMTGRLPEWVASFVDIAQVPSLLPRYRQQEAARECAYREPWSSAVLVLADAAPEPPSVDVFVERCAATLGATRGDIERSLHALIRAGALAVENGRVVVSGSLLADTRRDPARSALLGRHWSRAAGERAGRELPGDLHSYNVFSVSREGFDEIRSLQLEFYRRARTIIAASEHSDVAGLMSLHLVQWTGSLDEASQGAQDGS